MRLILRLAALSLVASPVACSDDAAEEKTVRGNAAPSPTATPAANAERDGTDVPGATPTPGGGGNGVASGKTFFLQTVVPLLEACKTCHAEPRIQVATRGPLSIFAYDTMRAMLAKPTAGGDASDVSGTTNQLYAKVRGWETHTGGDRCSSGGIDGELCGALYDWWVAEFPDKNPGPRENPVGGSNGGGSTGLPTEGVNGSIDRVSVRGRVSGWAADDGAHTETKTVTFVVGGLLGVGTTVGTATANLTGYDGSRPGGHAFAFDLPAAQCNGTVQRIYAYTMYEGEETLLTPNGIEFIAFTPKAAGRTYYDANILPIVTSRCKGCHGQFTYDLHWNPLVYPTPVIGGGTATTNTLYRKASGLGHGGGAHCGPSAAPALCTHIEALWEIEFGDAG